MPTGVPLAVRLMPDLPVKAGLFASKQIKCIEKIYISSIFITIGLSLRFFTAVIKNTFFQSHFQNFLLELLWQV